VTTKVIGTPHQARCVRALLITLWYSAVAVLISPLLNIELTGRSEIASLNLNDVDDDAATRFLTPTTFVAVAVVGVCIVYLISGKPREFRMAPWLIPAGILMVMAFSRNHLLGLAVTVAFALLAFRSARSGVAVLRGAIIVALVGLLLEFGAANIFASLPGAAFVTTQADSYVGRVIDGLAPEKRAVDPSVLFREKEDEALTAAISQSPWLGHGFGYAYKSPTGPVGSFFETSAPYYAHNFYLWFLLKVGVVGMLTFVWLAFVPLLRVLLRPASTMQVATAAAAAGLLAISVFAPMPNDAPGAPLLGAVLGIAVALTPITSWRRSVTGRHRAVAAPISPALHGDRELVPLQSAH
jgi:O-Antigen ligase